MREKEREMGKEEDKQKEKEEEEEEELSIVHFIHDHPLFLIETDKGDSCQACKRYFSEEAAYACKECGNEKILHQECAEMPKQIRHHPLHPHHTLFQKKGDGSHCTRCEDRINRIGYFCNISTCGFQIHLACAPAVGVKYAGDEQTRLKHPSHPEHELVLVRKRHLFKCDACGTMERGRSYVCLPCEYWIHERCATLPMIMDYPHHKEHPLSLAFYLPTEYIKFLYNCDMCSKDLVLNRWVYHCQICRYVVHLKCALSPPIPILDSSENAYSVKDCIQFPIKDAYEELIKEFVVKERGELMVMPHDDQKYTFHNHPSHQLSLVEINDNDEDDDDDGVGFGQRTVLACDGCTVPISSSSSSSSSSTDINKYNKYYMSCGECKYSLHVACFNLPPELASHPLHKEDHKLILQSPDIWYFGRKCSICEFFSNGLFYDCTECNFKADIKCASLPNTIKHVVHPQHRLHSTLIPAAEIVRNVRRGYCGGCSSGIYGGMFYKCGSCDFTMCNECCLLPPVNRHEGDKHPLPLRYDAHLNHPDEFYCDECEEQMIPKDWMYHCRDCDTSFHPRCFPPTSGEFRNFKFGNKYGVAHIHPHPLTFQILTTKLRCDWCNVRVYGAKDVDQRGFHCSLCNFFLCLSCSLWQVYHLV